MDLIGQIKMYFEQMFPIIDYGWGAIKANGFWPLLDLLIVFVLSVARDYFQDLWAARGKPVSEMQKNVENLFILMILFYAWEMIPASFGHGYVGYEILDVFFIFLMFYLHDKAQELEKKMKFKLIWQGGSFLSIIAIMLYIISRRTIP
ncbi:hypothetical protein IKF04_02040 [Candidatus Saccharibacteria bacterium]|nr:hypothetical protein [Candidatus Saccharibacteria bacterium]